MAVTIATDAIVLASGAMALALAVRLLVGYARRRQRQRRSTPGASDGIELQVIDTDGYNKRLAANGGGQLAPYQTHGSLYFCVGAKTGYLRPAGEWNFQEIDVDGQRIRVTLNGTKILDVDIDALDRAKIEHPPKGLDRRSGLVGLAGHSDPVAFRSFKIRRQ
jgi:hypothetical protein